VIELLEKVCQGNVRAIARTITAVENDEAMAKNVTAALYDRTGNAHLIGVTGPPGSGKSTLVNELAIKFNDQGKTVGIIAVDPSSPFTGGSILGDRVRMTDIVNREGVFVRSMATRGTLGGLAQATSTAIRVLDAAGFEIILIETVGAGQAEIDIASVAHTVLVVEAPGSGDEVQSIKAGILEIADILVVNKADRTSALRTVRSLEMMLQLGQPMTAPHHAPLQTGSSPLLEKDAIGLGPWQVPVMQTIAISGEGIDDLVDKIISHRDYLNETGEILRKEIQRSSREIERLLQNQFILRIQRLVKAEQRDQLVTAVAKREMDPYSAAEQLLELAKDQLT
jgi:LAO/AO transport system kinase